MAPPNNSDEKSPPAENQMSTTPPNNVTTVTPASSLTASQVLDGFSCYANNNETSTTGEQERLLDEILDSVNASLDQDEEHVTTVLSRIQAGNNEDDVTHKF